MIGSVGKEEDIEDRKDKNVQSTIDLSQGDPSRRQLFTLKGQCDKYRERNNSGHSSRLDI